MSRRRGRARSQSGILKPPKIRLQRSLSFDSSPSTKSRKRLRKVATAVVASNRIVRTAWTKKNKKKKKKGTKGKKKKRSQLEKFDRLMDRERTRSRARGNQFVRCFSSIKILPSGISDFFTGSFTYARPSPIYDGVLYVGDKGDAANCVRLQNLGITHIVNATRDIPNASPSRFEYINVSVNDDEATDLKRHFRRSNDFVRNAIRKGGRVMIHCRAGVSRSVTLCIAYLMQCEGMRLRDAFSLVESRRSIIRPNNSFLMQLAKYEVTLFKTSSVSQLTNPPWNFPQWFLFRATLPSSCSIVTKKTKAAGSSPGKKNALCVIM